MNTKEACTNEPTGIAPVMNRNIEALLERRKAEENKLPLKEKLANAITRFMGSLLFVNIHLVLYGGWIAVNKGWIPGFAPFDPTLVILAMEASVEAIFLSTFILITQRQMMEQSERRAELNLQISLLAEHEITRLVILTREMAKAMKLEEANRPELDELSHDVKPEQVLERIGEQEKKSDNAT